jgi:hypothetical protein
VPYSDAIAHKQITSQITEHFFALFSDKKDLRVGDEQAYANNFSGYVFLDINLLKPSRIDFVHHPAPLLAMSDTQADGSKGDGACLN